jgi:hypothetical protein
MIVNSILLILAAIFNAVMDKTKDTIQYNTSVFKNWNKRFWNDEEHTSYFPYTKYKLNAWHLSKSLMIICICAALSCNIWEFLIYGIIWNLVFNFLYNKALKRI